MYFSENFEKVNPMYILYVCYNKYMDFEFSFGWMFAGIAIAIAGGLIVVFYRQIAEGLANGVSSYEKIKLFGIITIVVGLLVTANLHIFVLQLIINLMFGK